MSHKGDWHRLGNAEKYRSNYDDIFRKKDKPKNELSKDKNCNNKGKEVLTKRHKA